MAENGKIDENESVIRLLSSALNKSMELSLQRKRERNFLAAGFLVGLLCGIALSILIQWAADLQDRETFRIEFKKSIDRVDKRIDALAPLLSKALPSAGNDRVAGSPGIGPEEKASETGVRETATAAGERYQVFIHYHREEQKALAEKLKTALSGSGDFQVWNIERVPKAIRRGEIRFFHGEDLGGAEKIQGVIRSIFLENGETAPPSYPVRSLEEKYPDARKRLVEIWLSPR
ncbi:MAG TPA: hypothetical protein PKY58_09805 [Syntrophales bacterium]|nr:hypothetical protein [Syntrophales bacterium]HQB29562.1 hypothetical protein [Syntrophales bacterium]HQN78773.1 hypothetical protein [Syntrophales bacterium]HQQ27815.1 hypothetical protein [Syntrophales bacterium]